MTDLLSGLFYPPDLDPRLFARRRRPAVGLSRLPFQVSGPLP
ncbi:MAG: hypothetical protein ACRDPK_15630 [Carbonactinosporaceae bacterium]